MLSCTRECPAQLDRVCSRGQQTNCSTILRPQDLVKVDSRGMLVGVY